MVTADQLCAYVEADTVEDVEAPLATATALVERYVGGVVVPDQVLDSAILEVGSELFHRRNAPSGVMQIAMFDGAPIRTNRDPMTRAYPLLAPFMPGGFS